MAQNRRRSGEQAHNQGLSCEMCLIADEPLDMLHLEVEQPDGSILRTAHLCRRCVTAILAAAKALMEAEGDQQSDDADLEAK